MLPLTEQWVQTFQRNIVQTELCLYATIDGTMGSDMMPDNYLYDLLSRTDRAKI